MFIDSGDAARYWLRHWGPRAFTLGRIQRLIQAQTTCRDLCGSRRPITARGHQDAIDVLTKALTEHENRGE